MKKLARYLKHFKTQAIIGPLFKLIEAIGDLVSPLLMAIIIDEGVFGGDISFIVKYGLIIFVLNIVGLACATVCQKCASLAGMGVGKKIREDMFEKISDFSYAELDQFGTPSLINRITDDVDEVQNAVGILIRTVMRSPFLLIGSTIFAIAINAKLSLIFLVVMPLICLVLYFILKKTLPKFKTIRNKLDTVSNVTRENLSGVRVVRAFNKQKFEKARFKSHNDSLARTQMSVGRLATLLHPLAFLIVDAAIVAVIYFGGIEVNIGELTQGNLIAFVNYLMTIMLSIFELATILVAFVRTTASAHRINEVLEAMPSVVEKNQKRIESIENAPQIEFENVSFAYGKNTNPAIQNVNFTLNKGETLGILGGTASGKSSIVHMITRFYDTTLGNVKIDGVNVREYPFKQLREKIGLVPQKAILFAGTLRKNMKMGKKNATDEDIIEALKIAQAYDFVSKWPKMLDYKIMAGGKNVSGGQRQRLTIARALVGKPEIVILDDSSSALDYLTDANLRKDLKKLKSTTIIVSQRATSVKNADKIIVVEHGEIVGMGKHNELMETCAVYREMYESQTQLHGGNYEKK